MSGGGLPTGQVQHGVMPDQFPYRRHVSSTSRHERLVSAVHGRLDPRPADLRKRLGIWGESRLSARSSFQRSTVPASVSPWAGLRRRVRPRGCRVLCRCAAELACALTSGIGLATARARRRRTIACSQLFAAGVVGFGEGECKGSGDGLDATLQTLLTEARGWIESTWPVCRTLSSLLLCPLHHSTRSSCQLVPNFLVRENLLRHCERTGHHGRFRLLAHHLGPPGPSS